MGKIVGMEIPSEAKSTRKISILEILPETFASGGTQVFISQGALCTIIFAVLMLITSAISLFAASFESGRDICSSYTCQFFSKNGRLLGMILFVSGIVIIILALSF